MTTTMRAGDWIERLDLQQHPEGGWFRETYRSPETVAAEGLPVRFGAPHHFSTAIHFLLRGGDFSALHRLKSDEVWHFYAGSPLTVHVISPTGELSRITLGAAADPMFQAVVPAGHWFGASIPSSSADDFALVGCTVAPGFDFADFELARRDELLAQFPQHRALIEHLTRA